MEADLGFLSHLDFVSYIIEIFTSTLFVALCFYYGRKWNAIHMGWILYLLAGFYACLLMSDLYYVLTWVIDDYPFIFSPGDLSWVGAYFFLITIATGLRGMWTEEERRRARHYRFIALIAPLVCAVFCAVYIFIYPDITFNYLFYDIPLAILAYYVVWALLAGGKRGKRRVLLAAMLVWVYIQLFYDLFSTLGFSYGYAVQSVVTSWMMVAAGICIFFVARKEVAA